MLVCRHEVKINRGNRLRSSVSLSLEPQRLSVRSSGRSQPTLKGRYERVWKDYLFFDERRRKDPRPLWFAQKTHAKTAATSPARSSAKTPSDINASRVHRDYHLLDLSACESEMGPAANFSSTVEYVSHSAQRLLTIFNCILFCLLPPGEQRKREEWNGTHADPLLPECARGTDYISKLRAVLPRRPQFDQHGCHSKRRETSELGRTILCAQTEKWPAVGSRNREWPCCVLVHVEYRTSTTALHGQANRAPRLSQANALVPE